MLEMIKHSFNDKDWINEQTGYVQPFQLTYLLNECINTTNH